MSGEPGSLRARARFERIRLRVFREIHERASKRRAWMLVPFQGFIIAMLVMRGEPTTRILVQVACAFVLLGALRHGDRAVSNRIPFAYGIAAAAGLVAIANTGGIESPLLISVMPLALGMGMNPNLATRRVPFLGLFVLAFGAMALASRYASGATFGALGVPMQWTRSEYVTVALASTYVAIVATFKMGRAVTAAYEQISLELAERREELCDESEGHTRALEGIAARLAHEVKNPLAAIKGLSTHMARNAEDPKVKERLSIVAGEAERLQEIVEGFLSFSRGLDELAVAPTKPFDIARELSLLLETRASDAGVTLDVRGSRELTVFADGKKLRQALLNLVLNAMQASPSGSTVALEVAKSCADGAAVIRIIDRGDGMTPDVIERIRKPYYTTKEGGSGLGIAVARGVIEQHGGSLRFESAVGRGTTVTILLPPSATEAGEKRMRLPGCRDLAAATTPVNLGVVLANAAEGPDKIS